jgi:hypothetical protein
VSRWEWPSAGRSFFELDCSACGCAASVLTRHHRFRFGASGSRWRCDDRGVIQSLTASSNGRKAVETLGTIASLPPGRCAADGGPTLAGFHHHAFRRAIDPANRILGQNASKQATYPCALSAAKQRFHGHGSSMASIGTADYPSAARRICHVTIGLFGDLDSAWTREYSPRGRVS